MPRYDSAGFEVGNTLSKQTYPAARLKRPGPPPAGQGPDFDPEATRGSPIRVRNSAFAMGETNGRAVLAFGPYVGPGLIKWVEFTHTNLPDANPIPYWTIFYNTTAYVTANNLPVATLPVGSPIMDARSARDDGNAYIDEGGVVNVGQTINGARFLLDFYVPDTQFFLALVIRNQTGSQAFIAGKLLVYEGVLPSDYPAILG